MQIIQLQEPTFKSWMFKSGENQVRLTEKLENCVCIDYRYSGDSSLFQLAHAVDCLRRGGVKEISLFCPYFPGARQDRACSIGDSLGAKVYADFINSLGFVRVDVLDAHSDVVPALVNNCFNHTNHRIVLDAIRKKDRSMKSYLVSPDAGANKKVFTLNDFLRYQGVHLEVIRADKKRNPENGKIEGTQVFANDLNGSVCFIVDDIISGGKTFMSLADELHSIGASGIHLIVSHHEGVASERELKEHHIDSLTCTNSLPASCITDSEFTTILPITPCL